MPRKAGIPNMNRQNQDVDKLTFRIPREKRIQFERQCDEDKISMTEQINILIDEALAIRNQAPKGAQ